jgi:dipeptidyl-peptidase 4
VNPIRPLIVASIVFLLAPWLLVRQASGQPAPASIARPSRISTDASHPGEIRWEPEGNAYLDREAAKGGQGVDIVRLDAVTGSKTTLVAAAQLRPQAGAPPLSVEGFDLSRDGKTLLVYTNSRRVWRSNTRGDYWALDLRTSRLHKLGGDAKPSTLSFAKLSPDGSRVGYVCENNLYVERLDTGHIIRLTADGSPLIANGAFDWVYEEEFECRDGWRWSPDGKKIAYWQIDATGVKEFHLINDTESLYPVITSFPYPKAGEMNSAARIGVIAATGGRTTWLQISGDARNNYLPRMDWAANAREIVVQQMNRLQNTNVVLLGDAHTGATHSILTEKDDAWVDIGSAWGNSGPGSLTYGDIIWLADGKRFLWMSERDGWRHVYSVSRDGADVRCLTPGNYDVMGVEQVDERGGRLYYDASPDNPTQRYLFRANLDGKGEAERLSPTNEPGTHAYDIPPHGDLAVHTYSTFTTPPLVELVRLSDHGSIRLLSGEAHPAPVKDAGTFFRVDIGGGVELDGWMIKPPNFDPTKHYPVLFNVYSEPAAQTVLDEWDAGSGWHRQMARMGYIIISVDNRGTPAPRGRAWRKAIYRHMGVLNSQDQAAAARVIAKWPYIDPTRIGIWGWSGGGTATLNALLRYPDLYRMGMSVAPVPDMHYYDTIYQERYCGLPQDHPDEYRQGSPVTFANQLKGKLLIVHGTGDDNVHYQGTEALINALVAADKPFTMMAYPNRSHGIYEGPGTTEHLFHLLERFLTENLPPGPRAP